MMVKLIMTTVKTSPRSLYVFVWYRSKRSSYQEVGWVRESCEEQKSSKTILVLFFLRFASLFSLFFSSPKAVSSARRTIRLRGSNLWRSAWHTPGVDALTERATSQMLGWNGKNWVFSNLTFAVWKIYYMEDKIKNCACLAWIFLS